MNAPRTAARDAPAGGDFADRLHTHLSALLLARTARGRPLLALLDERVTVYRPAPGCREDASLPVTPRRLTDRGLFRAVALFGTFLDYAVGQALRPPDEDRWAPVLLRFAVVQLCRPARRLLVQLQRDERRAIDLTRLPADFDRTLHDCLECAGEGILLRRAAADALMVGIRRRADACARATRSIPRALRFRRTADGRIDVDWFSVQGKQLRTESLLSFVHAVSGPECGPLLEQARALSGRRGHFEAVARGVLEDVCPSLARDAEWAIAARRRLARRLCLTRLPTGFPADLWVFLDPTAAGGGEALLSLRRAHTDFILASACGERFYFPPCLLNACLTFQDAQPRFRLPTVRQPKGGFPWRHPYTGCLETDPWADARGLEGDAEILPEPSPEALRLFEGLPGLRIGAAVERDMCLAEQGSRLMAARARLRADGPARGQADVLGAFTAVHDILHMGLTRGHQLNESTPRARLDASSMQFPVRGPVGGSLARRVYPYDPRRVRAKPT